MVGQRHGPGSARRMTAVGVAERPGRSLRRPRRGDVVTYRVRIDLEGTGPALWRRLELASDLFLDQLHDIIQVAFGWTDSHLHRFDSGADPFGAQTEHYLCPFDVDEGDTGIPEGYVRLDEVLAERGDRLFYSYDYGDDWQHVIVLEAVLPPMAQGSGLAVCTDGRRRGPAEDCGGTHIYQLVEQATDPGNARAADAAAELSEIFGSEVDIEAMIGTDYSADEINGALDLDWGTAKHPAASGRPRALDLSMLPRPVAELLDAGRISPDRRETAQRAGLLRKSSGRLQLTPRGRAARADAGALWWRLAESMPAARDDCGRQAGLLLLLILAAREATDWEEITARVLTTIGWRTGFGEALTSSAAFHAAWNTHSVLRRIGAFEPDTGGCRRSEPGGGGVSFARAALLTSPALPRTPCTPHLGT